MLELIANGRFRHLSSPVPPKTPRNKFKRSIEVNARFRNNRNITPKRIPELENPLGLEDDWRVNTQSTRQALIKKGAELTSNGGKKKFWTKLQNFHILHQGKLYVNITIISCTFLYFSLLYKYTS
ncbi:uncharacterized protein LOC128291820 [Gossypium arboreum]|uniref:uncharacterized protein LOC128291820 n=1 Tax=Gossypium arboreum TaxID=29729 RepID=UPI0022F18E04|nr:uncharacterized protein LOC128291820 [Gossypium arboreum]